MQVTLGCFIQHEFEKFHVHHYVFCLKFLLTLIVSHCCELSQHFIALVFGCQCMPRPDVIMCFKNRINEQ